MTPDRADNLLIYLKRLHSRILSAEIIIMEITPQEIAKLGLKKEFMKLVRQSKRLSEDIAALHAKTLKQLKHITS